MRGSRFFAQEVSMPQVGGRSFGYGPSGRAAAKKYAKKTRRKVMSRKKVKKKGTRRR